MVIAEEDDAASARDVLIPCGKYPRKWTTHDTFSVGNSPYAVPWRGGVGVGRGVGRGAASNDFAAIKEERGVFCALIMVEKLAV